MAAFQDWLFEKLPLLRRRKAKLRVTVGLDFGTSTVKCIVSSRAGERGLAERRVLPIAGEPLFPSTLWLEDGRLFLAEPPSDRAGMVRSLKTYLRRGILTDAPKENPFKGTPIDAEMACWALLSYCVNQVKAQLQTQFPASRYACDWDKDVEWNMGAPLDGIEATDAPLRKRYENLLWRAVHGRFSLTSTSVDLRDIAVAYRGAARLVCPPPASSNCFIFSEAHVAVNAVLHSDQTLDSGLYFVFDVGAGTTDITFFRFTPHQKDGKPIVLYDSACTRVGGDDFLDAVCQCLRRIASHDTVAAALLADVGRDATIGAIGLLSSDDAHGLGIDQSTPAFRAIHEKLLEGRKRAFYERARPKDLWQNWRKGLRAIAMGGGSEIPGVKDTLLSPLRTNVHGEYIRPEEEDFEVSLPHGATPLHAIAYGLSIPAAQYYDAWDPSEVDVPEIPKLEEYVPWKWGNPYLGK